jgi:hypothetical protein
MVIAEALNRLKDLESDRRRIQEQLTSNLYILPDLKEAEKPAHTDEQLVSLRRLSQEIAQLKVAITRTNLETRVEVRLPESEAEYLDLMQLIKRIELMRFWEGVYTTIAQLVGRKDTRYFSRGSAFYPAAEPIQLQANFEGTAQTYSEKSIKCRSEARIYEQALAKANWRTEVIGV